MIQFLIDIFGVKAVHAAADPLLVNAAGDVGESVKDNVYGAVTSSAFLVVLGALLGLFIILAVVPRLMKRWSK